MKLKKTKLENKVVIFAFAFILIAPIILYIFVLAPIYSLVGNTTKTEAQTDRILHRASLLTGAMKIAAYICAAIVVGFLVRGLVRYISTRSQVKKK